MQDALAALHAVQVRGDEVAAQTEFVALLRRGVVALQILGLARHAVARDGRRMRQLAPAACGKLLPLASVIKLVEHLREVFARLDLRLRAVLRDGTVGEIDGLSVAVENDRCITIFLYSVDGTGKFLYQCFALRIAQRAEAHIGLMSRAEGEFARDERRNAGVVVEHPLVDGLLRVAAALREGDRILFLRKERQLVERRRQVVEKAGQQLPRGGKVRVHAAQAFDDAPLRVEQNEVRAPAHAFEHELLAADLSEFVRALERQDHHALKVRLLDGQHARAD